MTRLCTSTFALLEMQIEHRQEQPMLISAERPAEAERGVASGKRPFMEKHPQIRHRLRKRLLPALSTRALMLADG